MGSANPLSFLEMDFYSDVVSEMQRELLGASYILTGAEVPDEICRTYLSVLRRRIPRHPRNVLIPHSFQCPSNLESGFALIKEKAERGDDLKPHQTRGLKYVDDDDALLKDWGIHHLHLGTTIERDGYVNRTGPLLYARVTVETVYCIAVLLHGAWSDQRLLQILHDNWPESLSAYKLRGITSLFSHSNEDIASFRRAGVQAMCRMADATVYAPLGGGYATSGDSIVDTRGCMEIKRLCKGLEEQVKEKARETGTNLQRPLKLALRLEADRTLVVHRSEGVVFLAGPPLLIHSLK